jgi:pseudouridine-5'-phosphate glycosidase
MLVANPLPVGEEIPAGEIAGPIEAALAEAAAARVAAKDVTPFLLARVVAATGGRSLAVNRAIIRGNAALAARLATALSAARRG